MKQIRIATFLFAALISVFGSSVLLNSSSANAASASDWNASNIIDDAIFYDNSSMSTADIQAFMNSKNPSCDTQGTRPASEYGRSDLTHAQYAASVGWPGPPYVCLRDYYQVPQSDQNINNLSTNVRPNGSISAAEIIKRASDTYGVNPKVLLVLIQKESVGPLLTDTWPIPAQYRSVVGYACPDTAPCDPKYAGFYNQIMNAAYQFKYYKDHAFDKNAYGTYIYNHQPYNTVALRFNPNASCGSTQTRMDNYATTGLYNYTPYQPNQAALNNMYGTGDGCSAYGNRNFWRMFNDWFGSVRGYIALDSPRWMYVPTSTHKKDPTTGNNIGQEIVAGTQLRFVDKTLVNGQWYLRTEHDKNNNLNRGIPQASVTEVPYQTFEQPRYMQLATDSRKLSPTTGNTETSSVLKKDTIIKFVSKITINNTLYYRTEHDTQYSNNLALPASNIHEATYRNFENPRYMRVKLGTYLIDPIRGTQSEEYLNAGSIIKFTTKIPIGNGWYYQTETHSSTNSPLSVNSTNIEEVPYVPLANNDTWFELKEDAAKKQPSSALPTGGTVAAGTQFKAVESINIAGIKYYRSEYDKLRGIDRAFEEGALTNTFLPMEQPREMTFIQDTQKYELSSMQQVDTVLKKDDTLMFTSKSFIDGVWYLRSEHDTNSNLNKGIRISDLSN